MRMVWTVFFALLVSVSAFSQTLVLDQSASQILRQHSFDFNQVPSTIQVRVRGSDFLVPEDLVTQKIKISSGEVITLSEYFQRKDQYSEKLEDVIAKIHELSLDSSDKNYVKLKKYIDDVYSVVSGGVKN